MSVKLTNSAIKIACAICEAVKDYDIDSCILAVIEKISGGHKTGLYRCCKECQDMSDLNPLAYEKNRFILREHLVELTAMKYGVIYKGPNERQSDN